MPTRSAAHEGGAVKVGTLNGGDGVAVTLLLDEQPRETAGPEGDAAAVDAPTGALSAERVVLPTAKEQTEQALQILNETWQTVQSRSSAAPFSEDDPSTIPLSTGELLHMVSRTADSAPRPATDPVLHLVKDVLNSHARASGEPKVTADITSRMPRRKPVRAQPGT
mmetsp:Transcript_8128/g.24010  ORF Transcript_8128/g.24010 Transcript_8128/m.24010 type:complete len:166 (+) Transcript_8128:136-633(+)